MVRCAAILLAGGSGTRVAGETNKTFLPVAGRPLLRYSLETLLASPAVDRVVLVVRGEDLEVARGVAASISTAKPLELVPGGATRHASESAGLMALVPDIERGEVDVVAIHDAARPFLSHRLLAQVIEVAATFGGAIPGLPLPSAVIGRSQDGRTSLVPTGNLRTVQTPQAFRAAELLAAYRDAAATSFEGADTAETMARFGRGEVRLVEGDPRNRKVTFRNDLRWAEAVGRGWTRGRR